jgi:hypothetical protein
LPQNRLNGFKLEEIDVSIFDTVADIENTKFWPVRKQSILVDN